MSNTGDDYADDYAAAAAADDANDDTTYRHFTASMPSYYLSRYCGLIFSSELDDEASARFRHNHFLSFPESFAILISVGALSLMLPEAIYVHFRRGFPLPDHPFMSFTTRFLPSLTGVLHVIAVICGLVAMGNDYDRLTAGSGDEQSAACDLMYGFASALHIGVAIPAMCAIAKVSRSRRGLDLLCPRPSDDDTNEGQGIRRRNPAGDHFDEDLDEGIASSQRIVVPSNGSDENEDREVIVKNFDKTLRHWHSIGAQPILWLSTPYLLLVICACLPVFVLFLPVAILLVFSTALWVGLVVALVSLPAFGISVRPHAWKHLSVGTTALALPTAVAACSLAAMAAYAEGLGQVSYPPSAWGSAAKDLFLLLGGPGLWRFDRVKMTFKIDRDQDSALLDALGLTCTAACLDLLNEILIYPIARWRVGQLHGIDHKKPLPVVEPPVDENPSSDSEGSSSTELETSEDEDEKLDIEEQRLNLHLETLEWQLQEHHKQLSPREKILLSEFGAAESADVDVEDQSQISNNSPRTEFTARDFQYEEVSLLFRDMPTSSQVLRKSSDLRRNNTVKSLTLDGSNSEGIGGGVGIFMRVLELKQSLKHLRIHQCRLVLRGFDSVTNLIAHHQSICHLDLSDNGIDQKMLHELASALEHNQIMPLERLNLTYNPLAGHSRRLLGVGKKGDYEGLFRLIATMYRRVKVLELGAVGLDEWAHEFEPRIFGNYFAEGLIERLDLSHNNIGNGSIQVLLDALSSADCKLREVIVSGNHIDKKYIEHFQNKPGNKCCLVFDENEGASSPRWYRRARHAEEDKLAGIISALAFSPSKDRDALRRADAVPSSKGRNADDGQIQIQSSRGHKKSKHNKHKQKNSSAPSGITKVTPVVPASSMVPSDENFPDSDGHADDVIPF